MVLAALADVPDPEIPAVSIVELGMVGEIEVDDRGIRVELLPTFVGCPALEVIRDVGRAPARGAGRARAGRRVLRDALDVRSNLAGGPREAPTVRVRAASPPARDRPIAAGVRRDGGSSSQRLSLLRWRQPTSSNAPTAGPRGRRWRTSSGRRSAARSATARTAASPSSPSSRSRVLRRGRWCAPRRVSSRRRTSRARSGGAGRRGRGRGSPPAAGRAATGTRVARRADRPRRRRRGPDRVGRRPELVRGDVRHCRRLARGIRRVPSRPAQIPGRGVRVAGGGAGLHHPDIPAHPRAAELDRAARSLVRPGARRPNSSRTCSAHDAAHRARSR